MEVVEAIRLVLQRPAIDLGGYDGGYLPRLAVTVDVPQQGGGQEATGMQGVTAEGGAAALVALLAGIGEAVGTQRGGHLADLQPGGGQVQLQLGHLAGIGAAPSNLRRLDALQVAAGAAVQGLAGRILAAGH